MRTTETVLVPTEITTYKCDFCDTSVTKNTSYAHCAPIERCHFCQKDACNKHREWYSEDNDSDYPRGIYTCNDCTPRANAAWDYAKIVAGRYEDIIEVMEDCFKNSDIDLEIK